MLTPSELNKLKFDKTVGVGYKADQVDQFVSQVSSTIVELTEEKEVLQQKLEVLADKLKEYRDDEESLRAAILGAQKLGDSVVRESKAKAELILRDASIKAEKLVDNAKSQIAKEQHTLERMREEVSDFKNRLLSLYKQHLELISALPEYEKEEEQVEEESENPPLEQSEATTQEPEEMQPLEAEQESVVLEYDVEEQPAAEEQPRRESKFSDLKFGENYDLIDNRPNSIFKRKK